MAAEGGAGVDEHDLALLRNGSILAVLRTNGPSDKGYLQKLSHDGGRSWQAGADMAGIGAVCPRLLVMPGSDGPLLLSGGRGKYSGFCSPVLQ